tara:strand:+ start:1545 stop:1793 length:249 start_codon:yes stop_codon:yes gene_type:complete
MKILLIISFITFSNFVKSDEIIKDLNGDYFLIKNDGTYKKLPNPKPGNKYVIKKKNIEKKIKRKIFERPQKKSRLRTNQGFR